MSEHDERADQPSAGGGQGRGEQASRKALRILEKLVDKVDVAAAFLVESLAEDVLDPMVKARRVFWIFGTLFLLLGVFGFAAPEVFMTYLPYILGSLFAATGLGLLVVDRQLAKAEAKIRELLSKAKAWKSIGSWARELF